MQNSNILLPARARKRNSVGLSICCAQPKEYTRGEIFQRRPKEWEALDGNCSGKADTSYVKLKLHKWNCN